MNATEVRMNTPIVPLTVLVSVGIFACTHVPAVRSSRQTVNDSLHSPAVSDIKLGESLIAVDTAATLVVQVIDTVRADDPRVLPKYRADLATSLDLVKQVERELHVSIPRITRRPTAFDLYLLASLSNNIAEQIDDIEYMLEMSECRSENTVVTGTPLMPTALRSASTALTVARGSLDAAVLEVLRTPPN